MHSPIRHIIVSTLESAAYNLLPWLVSVLVLDQGSATGLQAAASVALFFALPGWAVAAALWHVLRRVTSEGVALAVAELAALALLLCTVAPEAEPYGVVVTCLVVCRVLDGVGRYRGRRCSVLRHSSRPEPRVNR